MSFENPQNLISSWNLQTSFATGPVLADQLVPKKFARIRTPFVCTWREEKLNSILDHSSSNFSIYLPESLRVLKECYLKIEVYLGHQDSMEIRPNRFDPNSVA